MPTLKLQRAVDITTVYMVIAIRYRFFNAIFKFFNTIVFSLNATRILTHTHTPICMCIL